MLRERRHTPGDEEARELPSAHLPEYTKAPATTFRTFLRSGGPLSRTVSDKARERHKNPAASRYLAASSVALRAEVRGPG